RPVPPLRLESRPRGPGAGRTRHPPCGGAGPAAPCHPRHRGRAAHPMSAPARFAAELLRALERQGVRYAVVGSAREDIGRTDEDVDLLVDPAALAALARPIARYCRDTGGGFYVAAPADAFIYSLLKGVTKPRLPDADAARLSREWREDPGGARERIARYWPAREAALLADAARRGRWDAVHAGQPHLRR